MGDTIPQVTLGAVGVDLVDSPIQTPDGGLLAAQNVEIVRTLGVGGVGSRGSLTPLNSVTLAGPVLATIAVPLASALDGATIDAFFAATPGGFLYSTDGGVTWIFISLTLEPGGPSFPGLTQLMDVVALAPSGAPVVVYAGAPAGGATPIGVYNPATQTQSNPFSVAGAVTAVHAASDGNVYIASVTSANGFDIGDLSTLTPATGQVVQYNPNTGTHVLMGNAFGDGTGGTFDASEMGWGSAPSALADDGTNLHVWLGLIGVDDTTLPPDKFTQSIASDAFLPLASPTTWSLGTFLWGGGEGVPGTGVAGATPGEYFYWPAQTDFLATMIGTGTNPTPVDLAAATVQDSQEQFALGIDDTETLVVQPLSTNGAPPGGSSFIGPFVVFSGNLYVAVCVRTSAPSTTVLAIYQLVVSNSATLDEDVFGTYGGNVVPGRPYVSSGILYWPMVDPTGAANSYVLARTALGVWSQSAVGLSLLGPAVGATIPV